MSALVDASDALPDRDGGFPTADQRQFGRRLCTHRHSGRNTIPYWYFLVAFRDILVLFSIENVINVAIMTAASTALTQLASLVRLISSMRWGGGHLSLLTVRIHGCYGRLLFGGAPGYL